MKEKPKEKKRVISKKALYLSSLGVFLVLLFGGALFYGTSFFSIQANYKSGLFKNSLESAQSFNKITMTKAGTTYLNDLLNKDGIRVIVGDDKILKDEFGFQVGIIKKYQEEYKKIDFTTSDGKLLLEQAQKDTADRLIEDSIILSYMKQNNMLSTKEEVDAGYAELIKNNSGETEFAKTMLRYYGIGVLDFRNLVYEQRFERQKLIESFKYTDAQFADWMKSKIDSTFIYKNI